MQTGLRHRQKPREVGSFNTVFTCGGCFRAATTTQAQKASSCQIWSHSFSIYKKVHFLTCISKCLTSMWLAFMHESSARKIRGGSSRNLLQCCKVPGTPFNNSLINLESCQTRPHRHARTVLQVGMVCETGRHGAAIHFRMDLQQIMKRLRASGLAFDSTSTQPKEASSHSQPPHHL